jgi:hypothetical protein
VTTPTRISALIATAVLAVGACGHAAPDVPQDGGATRSQGAVNAVGATSAAPGAYSKVLVIAEENHGYDQIIGSPDAPYLNTVAATYGTATRLDAGYPTRCPSLAAYILITSGSTSGICDDRAPKAHLLSGDNVFQQVAASGREWRSYVESAPAPCVLTNTANGRYLVRHVPATYYLSERSRCGTWAVPMGEPAAGALRDDVAGGALPAFGFVSPDACHDMHGAAPCPTERVRKGDRWLKTWLPQILAGPDYTAGRLVVVITWDEGTGTDNHIPMLVISPATRAVRADTAYTHCSTLRTIEEILKLPLLGCAADAPSMAAAFHL